MTPPDPSSTDALIAFGAALLGAVVGGAASLLGSVIVDRLRLRRETRVRLYDNYIGEATAALARWETCSREGSIDLEHNAALMALAQVRRAAVIAGKADVKQVAQWDDAYKALGRLSIDLGRLPAKGSGIVDPEARDAVLSQVIENIQPIWKGLTDYLKWLERRLT